MKLADLLEAVKGLDPETVVCIAEVDEAFGAEIVEVEVVEVARLRDDAPEQEFVELSAGDRKAIVLRW